MQNIFSTLNSKIICLPFHHHLHIKLQFKASIYHSLLLHVSATKWKHTVAETGTSKLRSVLEMKVYVFVCYYSSQFLFKTFLILSNTHNYSWHVIQKGYKTISWWLTHTTKEPVHRYYNQQCQHIHSKAKITSNTHLWVSCSWHYFTYRN